MHRHVLGLQRRPVILSSRSWRLSPRIPAPPPPPPSKYNSHLPTRTLATSASTSTSTSQSTTADMVMESLQEMYATAKDELEMAAEETERRTVDRKSTRLNS